LLAGPPNRHLYLAARAAALASCGRGRDAAGLNEASRAAFRRQALDWLRAELDARRLLEKDRPASLPGIDGCRSVGPPEFTGVREPDAIGRLSEAERQAWQDLWAEVADTPSQAEGMAPAEQGAGRKISAPEW
jgi:hypothetical protein